MRFLALDELHVIAVSLIVALHGGMEAVAVQLMDEMLGFFQAVPNENAFPIIVNLQHVVFGFLVGPAENLLEHVRDVFLRIDRIVPANNDVARFVSFAGIFLRSLGWQDQRFCGRRHLRNVRREGRRFQPFAGGKRVTTIRAVLI